MDTKGNRLKNVSLCCTTKADLMLSNSKKEVEKYCHNMAWQTGALQFFKFSSLKKKKDSFVHMHNVTKYVTYLLSVLLLICKCAELQDV